MSASKSHQPRDPAPSFRPLPLLRNPHVQTLVGQVLNLAEKPWHGTMRLLPLDDGDQLFLHDSQPRQWQPGDPVALVVHGMGGSHQSPACVRITPQLLEQGVRVVRINLRGAGEGARVARKSYHGGCSEDVRAALLELHRWAPTSPLWLVGFSLGGNVVLKLAGEAGLDPIPNLERVAVVAPPIDLVVCSQMIEQPQNRIYDLYYSRLLISQARRQRRYFPDLPRVRVPRPVSLRRFDEVHTAPLWGFASVLDYFRKASSAPWMKHIRVPTFILSARDDPFVCAHSFEQYERSEYVDLQLAEAGGHLGFLGCDGLGGVRWAERRVTHWLVTPIG